VRSLHQLLPPFFFAERKVCRFLCTGILYSLFLWPFLNTLLCICLAGYWLLFCKKTFNRNKHAFRLVLLFSSLYLPYLIGMFYTANLDEGFFRLGEHIAFILFPFVFGCSQFLDKSLVRILLTHFVIVCGITSLAGFIFGMLPSHIILPEALRNGNQYIFGDTYPYIIGLACLLSLFIILEKLYDSRILKKGFIIFYIPFLSFYLLFLNVRTISFIWILLIVYFVYQLIRSNVYRMLISLVILILFIAGIYKTPRMSSKWNELQNFKEQMIPLDQDASLGKSWGGLTIRIALWRCGKDLISRHVLFGVGTGDVKDSLQQAYENRKFYFASRYNTYNLHNQYLQMLAGFGLFGLILLLACIVAPFICLRYGELRRIRIFFLLTFILICFTEVILDTNKGIIWYSFFNSIFAFGADKNEA